jgi:formamidopyrimidine-DNA glycosylase
MLYGKAFHHEEDTMPELPDVETFRRTFEKKGLNRKIRDVDVLNTRILDGITEDELRENLQSRSFTSSRRHGKNLFAGTDGGEWLVVHFGMSGFFHYFDRLADDSPHDRCRISFEDGGFLAYDNRRMIGRIALTDDPDRFIGMHGFGPDALSVDAGTFLKRFSGASGNLKQALMDQERVAGIGNVYADEILFQARISPQRSARELSEEDWRDIHRAMGDVWHQAIAAGADPERMPASSILPNRRSKGRCPACSGSLKSIKIGGRTTFFCPHCQPAGQAAKAPVTARPVHRQI